MGYFRSSWSSRATGNESLNASVPHEKTRHRPTLDAVIPSLSLSLSRRGLCPVNTEAAVRRLRIVQEPELDHMPTVLLPKSLAISGSIARARGETLLPPTKWQWRRVAYSTFM